MPPKKAAAPKAAKKPSTPRKKKVKAEPGSVGLSAEEVASGTPSTRTHGAPVVSKRDAAV